MGLGGVEGQRVVVTAGASGIGKVIAVRMAEAGAAVHVCDVDEDAVRAVGREHPEIGASVADVSSPRAVDELFERALARLGGLDVLVSGAGIAGQTALVEDAEYDDWVRTVDVNLTGAFLCARRAVPLLKQQRAGCIVILSSTAGLMGMAKRASYVASKWALIGLTRTLAMELGPFGVRANAICPGPVEGERMERVIGAELESRGCSREELLTEIFAGMSIPSLIPPEDVASMVLYLCSDAGSRISGQAIAIDGHTLYL